MGEVANIYQRDNPDDSAATLESNEQFDALERSIAATVEQAQREKRIKARTRELLTVNGKDYDYCQEKARRRAMEDVLGVPAS